MLKKGVLNENRGKDVEKRCFERNHEYRYEKKLFLTKSCVQIRKNAVPNEIMSTDTKKGCF